MDNNRTSTVPIVPKQYRLPFFMLVSCFALWGLLNNMTDNLVPAFSNIKLDMTNDFNKSVKKYVDEGKVNAYVPIPSDHRSTLAAYMQKYLAGELDRTELAGYLDDYWKNH